MSIISKIKCALTLGQGLLIENKELVTSDDPLSFFKQWLIDAQDTGIILPESMAEILLKMALNTNNHSKSTD